MQVLKIAIFTVLVTGFYTYVGQMVPQKEVHPPKEAQLSSEMSVEEMVAAGEAIVSGKGTCLGCHTMGVTTPGRFPDLAGIGERASSGREGMSGLEYLAESLYEPNTFIVDGYSPGMPPVNKPPISLNDKEVLTVIAYLQSLGGEPNVTLDTKTKYSSEDTAESNEQAAPSGAPEEKPAGPVDAMTLLTNHGCVGCHSLTTPDRLVGPSLYDLGTRMTDGQIYEAIMDPDAVVPEGYPPGVMSATLKGGGFYDKISAAQLQGMVETLSALKGSADGGTP